MFRSYPSLMVVALCVACGGSSFGSSGASGSSGCELEACGGSTAAGGAGQAGSGQTGGGQTGGGHTGSAGSASGGHAGQAGAAGSGTGGGSGGVSSAGSGNAGSGNAGSPAGGAGGGGGVEDCATLESDYSTAVQAARVCDEGSTDECSVSSTLPAIGCGCPALVNAKSAATATAKAKYQAIQAAKCNSGPICNIACLGYQSAACTQVAGGTGFMCTGGSGVPVN